MTKIEETRNYVLDEIKHNYLMSENFKKTCKYLNYVEHLLILVSTVTGSVSASAFALLVCVPEGITSSAVGIKLCAITAGIKKYKSIVNKNKNLVGKTKSNTIKVLIFKSLIESYISHDEFISANDVLREHNEMKNPETSE